MTKPTGIQPIKRTLRWVRLCVVGPPGVGKTRLAGTSPRGLIFRPPTDHTVSVDPNTTCEEWVFESWTDFNECHEYMRHEGVKEFDWFWLDGVSQGQETTLDDVFEDAIARKPSRGEYGPDKGEYGVNMYRLGRWMRHMTALPINFGVTAHPMTEYDAEGNERVVPYVQGKNMPERICGYMNVVGHLQLADKKGGGTALVLRTEQRGRWYAKDHYNVLGTMVSPTVPKIMSKIKGSRPAAKRVAKKKATTRRAQ